MVDSGSISDYDTDKLKRCWAQFWVLNLYRPITGSEELVGDGFLQQVLDSARTTTVHEILSFTWEIVMCLITQNC